MIFHHQHHAARQWSDEMNMLVMIATFTSLIHSVHTWARSWTLFWTGAQ